MTPERERELRRWALGDGPDGGTSVLTATFLRSGLLEAMETIDNTRMRHRATGSSESGWRYRFVALVPWRDLLLGLTSEGDIYRMSLDDAGLVTGVTLGLSSQGLMR